MNTLTVLNRSNVSIRFSIFYYHGDEMILLTQSSYYFSNGQSQTLYLPDEFNIILAIEKKTLTGNNEDIISTNFFNDKSKLYQLVGSFNNLKLIQIPFKLLLLEKKYISISNKAALPTERTKLPINCIVKYSLLNNNYSCPTRFIPKNGHLDYFVPFNSTNISLQIFILDSNRKSTLIETVVLNDYINLPKCYVVYRHLSGSTILVKELKCSKKN